MENIEGWERFSLAHPFLIKMCKVIIYGDAVYEIYNDGWSPENKRNALAHLKALESFEFVYVLVTLQHSLLYMKEAAVQLKVRTRISFQDTLALSNVALTLKT